MIRHLSASAISAFKACPMRYYLGYVLGLRIVEEKETRRIGTNWHKGTEIIDRKPGSPCICQVQVEGEQPEFDPDCVVCKGHDGFIPDDVLAAAIRHATSGYAQVPDWTDAASWATEREIIANTLAAYKWYYPEGEYKVISTEIPFKFDVTEDGSVILVGKIDKIVGHRVWGPMEYEYKSTSKPIEAGSNYWGRLRLDMQTSIYINAARDLQVLGQLPGVPKNDKIVTGLVHDVWHKATIRPKKLTQAETKTFLKERTYFNQTFTVENVPEGIKVGGWPAEITLGKEPKPTKKNPNPDRPFAIRETPPMFGARLLADIASRPEFYFARKTIPRSIEQLQSARQQVWHLHKDIEHKVETGQWWPNEFSCESTFTCDFCPICFNGVDVSKGQIPPGYRCLRSHAHLHNMMQED